MRDPVFLLNAYCGYAIAAPSLDELEARFAFLARDGLRRALAAGATLSPDELEALRVADDLMDQEASRLLLRLMRLLTPASNCSPRTRTTHPSSSTA